MLSIGSVYIIQIVMNTHKNQRLKITQLEKTHFIKVNELKLTEDGLF